MLLTMQAAFDGWIGTQAIKCNRLTAVHAKPVGMNVKTMQRRCDFTQRVRLPAETGVTQGGR